MVPGSLGQPGEVQPNVGGFRRELWGQHQGFGDSLKASEPEARVQFPALIHCVTLGKSPHV